MSASITLGSHEGLARRFDGTDPAHVDAVTIDEGLRGQRRLRAGALRFDDDGCSVFRSEIIKELGLPLSCITDGRYSAIAMTTGGKVETYRSGLALEAVGMPEYLARADPLEPGEAYLPAHSLIYEVGTYSSKTKRRAARGDFAGAAFVLTQL